MKRTLSLCVALCLALSACGGDEPAGPSKSPEDLRTAYAQAITAAQDQDQQEAFPVVTDPEDELMELGLEVMGLTKEDVTAFAVAMSLRNVQAYNLSAFMPAEGREDAVKEALEGYIENQKDSFRRYLEDQYEVAASAKLETLDDGTVLLIMCPEADGALETVKSALEEG